MMVWFEVFPMGLYDAFADMLQDLSVLRVQFWYYPGAIFVIMEDMGK